MVAALRSSPARKPNAMAPTKHAMTATSKLFKAPSVGFGCRMDRRTCRVGLRSVPGRLSLGPNQGRPAMSVDASGIEAAAAASGIFDVRKEIVLITGASQGL